MQLSRFTAQVQCWWLSLRHTPAGERLWAEGWPAEDFSSCRIAANLVAPLPLARVTRRIPFAIGCSTSGHVTKFSPAFWHLTSLQPGEGLG